MSQLLSQYRQKSRMAFLKLHCKSKTGSLFIFGKIITTLFMLLFFQKNLTENFQVSYKLQ